MKRTDDLASTIANLVYTPTLLAYIGMIVHYAIAGACVYLIALAIAYKSGAFEKFASWPMVSKVALYSGVPFIFLGLYFSTQQPAYPMLIPLTIQGFLSIIAGLSLRSLKSKP